ncbi:hypothetical protein H0H92_008507 [Tricholoma furcatifolium]|nr:hypothetical protein H0H92_008507 [Tricholoma furcatifolium]
MTETQSDLDFPRDLFYPILWYVKDLPYLWSLRQVSRDFAYAVEKVFIDKHMNKTWLTIDFGSSSLRRQLKFTSHKIVLGIIYTRTSRVHLTSRFGFDRMDPQNPSRVIFSTKECAKKFRRMVSKKLRSAIECGNLTHDPPIHVQIRRDLNDTAIPGLEFDFDKLEAIFEWKGLYSAFLREEAQISRRTREKAESLKSELLAARDSGKMTEMELLNMAFTGFANFDDEIRKAVRRERICREVWEKEGVKREWCYETEDAHPLSLLKDARSMIEWRGPYSDESDEDGGEHWEDEEGDSLYEEEYEEEDGMDEGHEIDIDGDSDEDDIDEEDEDEDEEED